MRGRSVWPRNTLLLGLCLAPVIAMTDPAHDESTLTPSERVSTDLTAVERARAEH